MSAGWRSFAFGRWLLGRWGAGANPTPPAVVNRVVFTGTITKRRVWTSAITQQRTFAGAITRRRVFTED